MVKASESQIDNLVALLDGYAQEGGHHLNVNVFSKETLLDAQAHTLKNIPAHGPGFQALCSKFTIS